MPNRREHSTNIGTQDRVLFLTHRLPYAPNRGDRIRAFHLIRELSRHFLVDVLSLVHSEEEQQHAESVTAFAASIETVRSFGPAGYLLGALGLASSRPTTHTLLNGRGFGAAADRVVAERRPAVVLAYCTGIARLALRPALRDIPLLLDMVDVDSQKWAALAESSAPPRSWIYKREALTLSRFEGRIARRAFVTLVTTDRERESLRGIAPDARIEVVQNGVDAEAFRPSSRPEPSRIVLFCGVLDYEPNVQAALWLLKEIWPLIRARVPDAELEIVGANPVRSITQFDSPTTGVRIIGSVPDVKPYHWHAAVAVAPLLTARGIQNKVLEAIAAGLPVVVTPVVFSGLPPEVHAACLVGQDAETFAAGVCRLLELQPEQRRELTSEVALSELSWSRRLAAVPDLIRAAASTAGDRK